MVWCSRMAERLLLSDQAVPVMSGAIRHSGGRLQGIETRGLLKSCDFKKHARPGRMRRFALCLPAHLHPDALERGLSKFADVAELITSSANRTRTNLVRAGRVSVPRGGRFDTLQHVLDEKNLASCNQWKQPANVKCDCSKKTIADDETFISQIPKPDDGSFEVPGSSSLARPGRRGCARISPIVSCREDVAGTIAETPVAYWVDRANAWRAPRSNTARQTVDSR